MNVKNAIRADPSLHMDPFISTKYVAALSQPAAAHYWRSAVRLPNDGVLLTLSGE